MKFWKALLSTLVLACFLVVSGVAQKNFSEEADNAFNNKSYSVAIDLYKKAYSKVKGNRAEKSRILFQIAECYRLKNDIRRAESGYKRVVRAKYPDPIAVLHYANILKLQGKYEEAIIQYEAYSKKKPDDPRGPNGLESCKLAQEWENDPTRYEVENMKKFNSRESDFSPSYADRKFRALVFTSTRDGAVGKKADSWTGESFSDLWIVTLSRSGKWSAPALLDEGNVNSPSNEGSAAFNKRANTIYFTRCRLEKKKKLGCEIYSARKRGRGWGEPENLSLAADSFTVGHPTISQNELEIIFASNMPGGQGGRDLWIARRTKKSKPFGPPKNLGPEINTAGDEMFPHLRPDGNLYFSSNGHLGMGGLDIFKTSKVGETWQAPENMKYPMNSSYDDFGITYKGNAEEGFFTSNRKGGRGSDDIYYFILPPLIFTLQGVVTNDSTGAIIPGALVKLVGSDGTVVTDSTDATGTYSFDKKQILENTSYVLTVTKQDFFGSRGKETTVGLKLSKDLVHDFTLVPIPPKPIVLPDILYDLAKWDLKPQFHDSLDGLLTTLKENPTIVIELGSHTDIRDTEEKNYELSRKRAQSVVDYLISKGIEPARLKPKGYGEDVPRLLEKDKKSVYSGKEYVFKAGTVLTEAFIDALPTKGEKEAAHQLNRRTTFKVLSDDYVPQAANDSVTTAPEIEIIKEGGTNPENMIIEQEEEGNNGTEGGGSDYIMDGVVREMGLVEDN